MFEEVIMEIMKSVDLQPLQHLAAVRAAISVCESEDVQFMISRFHKTNNNDGTSGFLNGQWRRLRDEAIRKFNQIGLPDLITDIVLENLWPISYEISKWILYHVGDMGIDCSPNFFWTPQVNIDYVKTAKTLIKNESLDIRRKFKLACLYCLHSEIHSLWGKMSLSEKTFYVQENLKKSCQNPIELYWIHSMREKQIGDRKKEALESFKYAVQNGHLSATRFFFGKLNLQLRTRMISNCFYSHLPKLYEPQCIVKDQLAIACFLICQLRSDYEGRTCFRDVGLVFRYFLEWPWQKHFMSVVNRLTRHDGYYFLNSTFGYLLEEIIKKDLRSFKDHDYKKLFMEFWRQSPREYKRYASTDSVFGVKVFMKFAKKHFGFVFEENSFVLKSKFRAIIFQQNNSKDATGRENVEFFKFLVQERVITRTSINRFSYLLGGALGELMYLVDGIWGISPIQP